jgi:hypothetical protein
MSSFDVFVDSWKTAEKVQTIVSLSLKDLIIGGKLRWASRSCCVSAVFGAGCWFVSSCSGALRAFKRLRSTLGIFNEVSHPRPFCSA